MSYIEAINEKYKAIQKLEDEIWRECEHLTTENGEALVNVPYKKLLGWFERTIAITMEYELIMAEAEREALARDLADCNRQREDLRDKLGIAIDYAHDVIELVNLDA